MHCMCAKCSKTTAGLFLLLGIAFLLVDLGVWAFWNVKWWTAVFLLIGLTSFVSGGCPDCKAMREKPKKK